LDLHSPLELLEIFLRWQLLGIDASIFEHAPQARVVLDVLLGDGGLSPCMS
jgi:hypothetical protein